MLVELLQKSTAPWRQLRDDIHGTVSMLQLDTATALHKSGTTDELLTYAPLAFQKLDGPCGAILVAGGKYTTVCNNGFTRELDTPYSHYLDPMLMGKS